MIQLPDGRWVRSDNLQPLMTWAATERSLTEAMCFVIPQLDEAKRALERDHGPRIAPPAGKPR